MLFVLVAREDCCEGRIPAGSFLVWTAEGFHVVTREHLDSGALGMAWQDGKLELIPQDAGLASLEAARLKRICAGLPLAEPATLLPDPRPIRLLK